MKKSISFIALVFLSSLLYGCTSSDPLPCENPTVSQCLDTDYCNNCEENGIDIESRCENILKNHYNSSKKVLDLVPELSGSEDTLRERYDVSYSDQPPLYVPINITPETYFIRNIKFGLLNINDTLVAQKTKIPILPDLMFNPTQTVTMPAVNAKKGPGLDFQLNPPKWEFTTARNYMFEGLSYDRSIIEGYFENLYTGKVSEWNKNGDKVESCEEFAYEKFYDFSLFKDYMSLYSDDHYRVVQYAFRGADIEQGDIKITDAPDGAIGSKFMNVFSLPPRQADISSIIKRKGGEPRSIFSEKYLNYVFTSNGDVKSNMDYDGKSPDINTNIYWDHVFAQNQIRLVCADPTPNCIYAPDPVFIPKNFFIEVLGKTSKANTDRRNGIVFNSNEITDLLGSTNLDYAKKAYNNSFKFHFLMYKAAKRQYPNNNTLKQKLLEHRLLRKHLIQLLAERSKYESLNNTYEFFSRSILMKSKTLPPSEKEYALMKLDEKTENTGNAKAAVDNLIPVTPPPITHPLIEIDKQIEALFLEAKSKGYLDIATTPSEHNYPTIISDDTNNKADLLYKKALCDWSPEMFTTAAIDLIPEEYYEKVYSDCMRVTGGDFKKAKVDRYKFTFPGKCAEKKLFSAWRPNETVDYTGNTIEFYKFKTLLTKYPEALLDCDSIIQGETKKALQDAGMNYYDPATGKVMMSKSRSYYDSIGGKYAGLNFGYALGWLYEGYDNIPAIKEDNTNDKDLDVVCEKTGFFAFGNYFAGGSFLTKDFNLCSAGSYTSNKTSGVRPVPPTLSDKKNEEKIIGEINEVGNEKGVTSTYFMFIKNEKITYNANTNTSATVKTVHSEPFNNTDKLSYTSPPPPAQMFKVDMEQSIPVCGIVSVTIRGSITGDIDADTTVDADKKIKYAGVNSCKEMDYNFTPHLDFDAFAQASVTAGIAGVASISAGVEVGLKFIGIKFPYNAELVITQRNGIPEDREFNYDVNVNAYSSLDQQIKLLSGYFAAFVKIEYVFSSSTYRQTLFSWDGIKFEGNVDRVAGVGPDGGVIPLALPVRALYGLSQSLYQ